MDTTKILADLKKRPGFAENVGMVLVHNGVVRGWARADHAPVKSMKVSHDRARMDAICRELGAVFVIGIGAPLADGKPHDGRSPDYDDWTTPTGDGHRGLNGDILIWYPPLRRAVELSSMGIRVDRDAMLRQLDMTGQQQRKELYFHRRLLAGELPQSIGGGIGQSRLCMVLLHKAHVGEIQASVWPQDMLDECASLGMAII